MKLPLLAVLLASQALLAAGQDEASRWLYRRGISASRMVPLSFNDEPPTQAIPRLNDIHVADLPVHQARRFHVLAAEQASQPEAHLLVHQTLAHEIDKNLAYVRSLNVLAKKYEGRDPRKPIKGLQRLRFAKYHASAEDADLRHEAERHYDAWAKSKEDQEKAARERGPRSGLELVKMEGRFRGLPLPYMTPGEAEAYHRALNPESGVTIDDRYVHELVSRFSKHRVLETEAAQNRPPSSDPASRANERRQAQLHQYHDDLHKAHEAQGFQVPSPFDKSVPTRLPGHEWFTPPRPAPTEAQGR